MAGGVAPSSINHQSVDSKKNFTIPLIVITSLFFMWGFITCLNDILIPKFKDEFHLSNVQANLVQFAFFGAYFVVSLVYYVFSRNFFDPISKLGYKLAIVIGLIIAALGCFMFVPAASNVSFGGFLAALFVLATGITILQMGANPYVTLLGNPNGAESRLNMTQAFNSLGTTVAPVLGGILILGATSVTVVKGPYVGLGAILLVIAIIIALAPLPKVSQSDSQEEAKGIGALKYGHLVLGVICIFAYVGGEVSIGSNIIQYLKDVIGVAENQADALLAVYWGGAMIGRFYGSIFLSEGVLNAKKWIQIAMLLVLAFFLGIFLINKKYVIDSFLGKGEFSETFAVEQIDPLMESSLIQNLEKVRKDGVASIAAFNSSEKDSSKHKVLDMYYYLKDANLSGKINMKSRENFKIDLAQLESAKKIALDPNGTEATFKYLHDDCHEFSLSYVKPVVFDSKNLNINGAFIFALMALVNIVLFVLGKNKAGITLGVFGLTVIGLLIAGMMGLGDMSMWAILSIGLFNSIMFPTIFSLAIKGLGVDTSQGASLLVMAIVGGGLVPLLHGKIADMISVQAGFIIPLLCYAYIVYYGFAGSKVQKK